MVKLGLCPGEHSTEKEARLFATLTVDVAQPSASSARQQCSHTNADCTLELWTKINLSPLKCLFGGGIFYCNNRNGNEFSGVCRNLIETWLEES